DRGHEVSVLTSTHGVGEPIVEGNVYRQLPLQDTLQAARNIWDAGRMEYRNTHALKNLITHFQPDVVSIWNMGRLSIGLLQLLAGCRLATVFALSDYWMLETPQTSYWHDYWQWTSQNRVRGWLKGMVKRAVSTYLPTSPERMRFIDWSLSFFTSAALRQH